MMGLLSLLACGCGPSGPEQFAISGQISYDSQPVTNGSVGFVPVEASSGKAFGADVVDGHYEIPRYEGPLQGTYKVMIHAERPSGRKIQADEGSSEMVDELIQFIPDAYNAQSTLTVEISSDREDLDFDLEVPKRNGRGRRPR